MKKVITALAASLVLASAAQAATSEREIAINAALCVGITVELSQARGDRYDRAADALSGIVDRYIKRGVISVAEMRQSVANGGAAARDRAPAVKNVLPTCMSVL